MGGEGGGIWQRGATSAGEMTTTMPPPQELTTAVELSDSEPKISFAFRDQDAVAAAVDTPILHSPYLPGVIYSSSWDCPSCPCSPVAVPTKTRKPWGQRDSSWYRMGEAGEETAKRGKESSHRRRVEAGRGGGNFLLQILVRLQFGGE